MTNERCAEAFGTAGVLVAVAIREGVERIKKFLR
jgi:hypothetical protein